jgi:GntR family transcriptional regulator, transcriptional repressor for pyruvate dehydrogenase complex
MDVPNARRIARAIADGIVAGEPPAGEMLESERALAARYGVGRPLIREALRSVEELGLIETRPGRGTFVRSEAAPAMHRGVGVAILRRGVTASQLSEARITLESEAASLAALRATPEDVAALEAALERLETSESIEHVKYDLVFHLGIAAAAHNPVIEMMLESIAPQTVALMVRSVGDPQVMVRSQPYHRVALEAIVRRDPGSARAAIVAHLSVASELYGDDFDRSVDELAGIALRKLGSLTSLDDVVAAALQARSASVGEGDRVRNGPHVSPRAG